MRGPRRRRRSVVLTTHELDEAERLADRVRDHRPRPGRRRRHARRADGQAPGDEIRFGAPAGLDIAALGGALGGAVAEATPGEYLVAAAADAGDRRRPHGVAGRARPARSPTCAPGGRRLEDVFLRLDDRAGERRSSRETSVLAPDRASS